MLSSLLFKAVLCIIAPLITSQNVYILSTLQITIKYGLFKSAAIKNC